ncbi:FixH family protein [Gracilibacillus caseinilyticus]|uniref:FixH family protein n=1 Tax=Gracilibacillus caseinilyticus TaxID=2932256 RepID=A0ABY4ESG5_9BACI|nr:FixH family protein [Gracilibacillus caseinilyticus]UOQ47011.1 FixH family protein [Gracilibacillus caseinilyticus]
MKKLFWLMLSAIIVLSACADNSNTEDTTVEDEVQGIEVNFALPEQAETGEAVTLSATVTTTNGEKVTDAEEMMFEYWNVEDEENSVMVESTNNEDGTYTAEVTFTEPGDYELYAHTTANGIHSMPKKAISVTGKAQNTEQESEAHEEEETSHEHEHSSGFEIKVEPLNGVTANEDKEITVQLMSDGTAYEGARVRYEIVLSSEKHEWIDAEEVSAGEYKGTFAFPESGTYDMTVHVNDEDGLHEHTETEVEVSE